MIHKKKLVCPICRLNNNINHLSYVVKNYDKLIIANHYNYLIKKSMKQHIVIISNNDKTIKFIKDLYKHFNLTCHIYNINSIKSIDHTNIYCLESKENTNINIIYNILSKKSIIHFFTLNKI